MKSIEFLGKNGVNIKKSLELFGDVDTYNDTIGEFLVGIHTKANQLVTCMTNKDLTNYAIYAHSMKSDAKYFGFTKLAEVAYEHELKGKAGDLYYVTSHINDLIVEINNSIKLIKEYMVGQEDGLDNTLINSDSLDELDRKTILVVDDSNIVRNFVKRIFDDKYNVCVARDGEEAIQIIKANMNNDFIETILLDLNMPKVDGFAVLEFMRENQLFKKMPTSIISGDSTKKTIDKAFTYEIVDMLSKPFNEQCVKSIIEKTMYRRELEQ